MLGPDDSSSFEEGVIEGESTHTPEELSDTQAEKFDATIEPPSGSSIFDLREVRLEEPLSITYQKAKKPREKLEYFLTSKTLNDFSGFARMQDLLTRPFSEQCVCNVYPTF